MNKFKVIFNLIMVLVSMALSSAWTMQIVSNIYDISELRYIGYWVTIPSLVSLLVLTIYGHFFVKRKGTNGDQTNNRGRGNL